MRKTEQGTYRFPTSVQLHVADFDREEKINTGNPRAGERRELGWGRGGSKTTKSHVNTNTNLRKEGCTTFKEKGFSHYEQE